MHDEIINRFVSQAPVLMKEYTIDGKGHLPKRLAFTSIRNTLNKALEHGIGQPRIIMINGLRGVERPR